MITPCFVTPDGSNYPINNLVIEGADDNNAVTVQVMNSDGTFGAQAFWINADGDYPAGWFTNDIGDEASDISLVPGQAVYFYTDSDTKVKVQSSGAVSGKITYSVSNGGSALVGNTTTATLPINSITVEGADDSDAVTVQVMNSDGTFGAQAFWINEDGDYPAGWFTNDIGDEASDIVLAPGQAVYLYSNAKDAKILIPSAL